MARRKVIIMGAAGRDFHNFNVFFRDNEQYEVIAFTAAQLPNIAGRVYPPELAGKLYPNGIPIYEEEKLPELIKKYNVDEVVLAYSDLLYDEVMRKASIAMACGATFKLLGPKDTMIESSKPVIAVCAARTGAGKSTVSRKVSRLLKEAGLKVAVIRHPMPYGDLRKQIWQRFEAFEDMDKHKCTIEEREEYEPHIKIGNVVYAGVDYEVILRKAEEEADVILWDGGNNDFPFIKPDLMITVVDPMRPGHELASYPGEINVRMADVIVINKVDTAPPENVEIVRKNVREVNPRAVIVEAASPVTVDDPSLIEGKRVLVVEDGPSVTHGGLPYGAGYIAAKKYNAKEIVDPRPYAVGSLKKVFEEYKHIANVLPAMGYGEQQIRELEATINAVDCDTIVAGTPIELKRIMKIDKPEAHVRYELEERGKPTLKDIIDEFISKHIRE